MTSTDASDAILPPDSRQPHSPPSHLRQIGNHQRRCLRQSEIANHRLYYGFVLGHSKRGESLVIAHELVAPTDSVRLSSNRAFGLAIGAALAAISIAPVFRGKPIRFLPLVAAAAFAALAVVLPSILAPLHRVWFRIALMLHAVMSPLMMAVLFFGVVTPVAVLMRVFGRHALDRRGFGDPSCSTFWIARARGPMSMKVPF